MQKKNKHGKRGKYHHGSNLFGILNNELGQTPGLDTTADELQKLLPLQAHRAQEQIEFDFHGRLLEQ